MREIKFRAWDKQSKKYRKLKSITFDEKGKIDVLNIWGFDIIYQKDIIINLNCEKELKRIVLEQYTGMKDAYGTRIYENDILAYAEIENVFEGVVKYDDEDGMFILNNDNITYNFSQENSEWYVVFGNIHEIEVQYD